MKKNLSLFLALIIMFSLAATPVYGMSLIGGHAGAETVHNQEAAPAKEETEDTTAQETPVEVGCSVPAFTKESSDIIREGIYAGNIDLSNMSAEEARAAIEKYVQDIGNTELTLNCVSGNSVNVKASDLGLCWTNTGLVDEALSLGHSGNVIKRFKDLSDLRTTNRVYKISLGADEAKIKSFVNSSCTAFDIKAKDANISRTDGKFSIVPGNDGQSLNVNESAKKIEEFLTGEFTGEPAAIDMVVDVIKPKGDTDTLSSLTDVLGTFTTKFTNSGSDRVTNVANGCRLINGTLMYPGEQISVSQTISPMTEENGYALAGSYLNGMVVESFGGGICQVSTTLYQAVLRAELQVDERYNHSMVVNYVDHSCDAAIAEGIKDFKFTNNLQNPIYIEGYTTPDKTITFTIYGVETRPSNRTLEFESVDIETMEPAGEKVVADSSEPAGYTRRQGAHIGYKSELYKIVKVDGNETERTLVNRSTYNAVPATLTVGTATSDPAVKSALEAAIATQNIDYCKAIASGQPAVSPDALAAALAAQAAAGGEQTQEAAPVQEAAPAEQPQEAPAPEAAPENAQ